MLTACGIETYVSTPVFKYFSTLQQCLPLAVLKLWLPSCLHRLLIVLLQQCLPLAVLKHGICDLMLYRFIRCNSAYRLRYWNVIKMQNCFLYLVATVLTACGIETFTSFVYIVTVHSCNSAYRLRYWNTTENLIHLQQRLMLQQCLPLAVLKPSGIFTPYAASPFKVATVLTACGIETHLPHFQYHKQKVATVLTACGIETGMNNLTSYMI